MADSFFGFDTSLSNLIDDEGVGEPSEDEYDALNDETFGQGSDMFDWEVEHEQRAEIHESSRESSRRQNITLDDSSLQLEASLSQLVLDDTDAPRPRTLGSSVWRSDLPFPAAPTPVPTFKNVCTVEELERQMREKQLLQPPQQTQQQFNTQNYYQPRFPPVILQRPPGLQAPVPLPFAPQQSMTHNLNQPLNKLPGPNNQMGQSNPLMTNHVNQMGQNMNQIGPNVNQMGPNMNQVGPNMNQMGPNVNQMVSNMNQMGPNMNQMGPNVNQMGHNMNQFMQNPNQMNHFHNNQMGQNSVMNMPQNMQNIHQLGQPNQMNLTQNMNQIGQNMNQIGQNMNQIGQNMNQLGQNANNLNQNVMLGPNMPQINQNIPQMTPNISQHHQNLQMGQNLPQLNPQMTQTMNQMNQNMTPMGPNMNQMNLGQNVTQMGQNMNQMGPNVNQMGQNVNQMMQNGNQFGQMNQYQHPMNQPRMLPGMNMPRQNFSPNVPQLNSTFRAQTMTKPEQQPTLNQQIMTNHQQSAKPAQPAPQSPQTVNVKKQEPKQKTRVYNNSKNVASQDLVQIIQNTQAWMIKNNCFNNANHHPILNNRGSSFNNQHMPMMNQRQNGMYNNMSPINSDETDSDADEYAGLMTQREKQWLINIQMLQLNTGTPYIHDFYYTVFLERKANKEKEGLKEAHKANQQNHPFYSGAVKQDGHGHRERHNSNRHNSTSEDGGTPRTYVPAQFENSLGKLQCGSVTAPRKIIDVELVGSEPAPSRSSRAPSVASTTTAEVPREMKRTKQLLLDIEALFLILLRLEELNDPLAIANAVILREREEKQKQLEAAQKELETEEEDTNLFLKNIESVQRRPKQDSPKSESIDKRQVVNLTMVQKPPPVKNLLDEDKEELVNKMFSGLLHGDRLAQMLTVRKGRTLICRFVARAGSAHVRLRSLWARLLRSLPAAARRDDGSLPSLASHYHGYIQKTTGWAAVLESCGMLSEALDPARTPYILTTAFTLSAVCALIEKASTLVNTPETTSNERQWYKFLKTVARALKHATVAVAAPVRQMPEAKLIYHVKYLESRTTVEILQRGKTADFTEITKPEMLELLVKHLC